MDSIGETAAKRDDLDQDPAAWLARVHWYEERLREQIRLRQDSDALVFVLAGIVERSRGVRLDLEGWMKGRAHG